MCSTTQSKLSDPIVTSQAIAFQSTTYWDNSSPLSTTLALSQSSWSSPIDQLETTQAFSLAETSLTLNDSSPSDASNSLMTSDYFGLAPQRLTGTLRADTFNISFFDPMTVVSGNGNVDFGQGYRDLLNLSNISYSQVSLELATAISGIVYNPGNGSRVFDSITLSGGQQILFEGIDGIQFAEGYMDLTVTPNDPLFNQQWNLHMMGTHTAWRFTTGSTNVMIGVEDTGLTLNNGFIHSDLGNTIWLGEQGIDDQNDNHGMNVQGIISATTNNGIGMSGINWTSQTFNIDVLGGEWSDLSIANAAQVMIDQARSQGQRLVINMSLGYSQSFNVNYDADFEQVVRNNPDVVFVIAAGNDGNLGSEGLSSPAVLAKSYGNVIAVGAAWGTQDNFGNATTPGSRIEYNGWWGSQYGDGLTLIAPSEVIAPTLTTDSYGQSYFDYTSTFNGTSAATPNVAGVASLLLSANPYLSASQVSQILSQTAVDVGPIGYDKFTGSGVVNADAAVRRSIAISLGYA